ncbi:hypothetical protein F511_27060 [Dorcoceras hygrometricum]|uniref:Dystroglycan-like n=1 Tax=Dorcoceras hygrometricum TaxID=472368 RepID=A0A2Z7CVL7_9LAMI|nr:hypothetical protein F511_27060 [Dorcoceras hygrometricum]
MVHEYKTLSHTFEEIKAENASLKNSSIDSSSDELEDVNSLKTKLSRLKIENDLLISESSELKAEVEKLTKEMSSWTQSARAFQKLQEIQKSALDRTGLDFSNSESSEGETSTQSQPMYDNFNKMGFVKADVIYDCCESIRYDDQKSSQSSHEEKGKGKDGIGYQRPESSTPSWLKNRLDKDKAKAGSKSYVPNQQWRNFRKEKYGWKKTWPRRDPVGQNVKSKLYRPARTFSDHLLLAMAASFYSNSVHVDFESALAIGEPGMVSMFQALIASGLQGFLGCPTVVYEEALVEFFANGTVRDGLVVSIVNGVAVEISEKLFAETFDLPVDGLADIYEMPKDKIFDARSIVSLTGEPVTLSWLKSQMKMHYRLLCDIMAKSISVKAVSFNAITVEKFSLLTAMTKDAGDRPAAEEETPADRPAEEIVSVEQRVDESAVEVSGVDVVDPETVVQQVLNQLDFSTEGQDVAKGDRVETWFDRALDEEFATAGDDSPTEKVNDEEIPWFVRPFLSADHDNERLFETESDSADTMDFEVHSQTLPVVRDTNVDPAADIPLPSASIEITKIKMGTKIQIPGVDEKLCYLDSLLQITTDDKGKALLVEKDRVKGHPAREHYFSICANIDLLFKLREQIIEEVDRFFHSFSFKKLASINVEEMSQKEDLVLSWGETESIHEALSRKRYILLKYREMLVRKFLESWKKNFKPGEGTSATDLQVIDMLWERHLDVLQELSKQKLAHGLLWDRTCCSAIFEGSPRDRGAVIARTNTNTPSSLKFFQIIFNSARANGWLTRVLPCKQSHQYFLSPKLLAFFTIFTAFPIHRLLTLQNFFDAYLHSLCVLLSNVFQAQENHNILHAQLSELVNYINRGGADKKGEVAAEDLNGLRMFKSEIVLRPVISKSSSDTFQGGRRGDVGH